MFYKTEDHLFTQKKTCIRIRFRYTKTQRFLNSPHKHSHADPRTLFSALATTKKVNDQTLLCHSITQIDFITLSLLCHLFEQQTSTQTNILSIIRCYINRHSIYMIKTYRRRYNNKVYFR